MINGIHHVSMKTCSETEYQNARSFYTELLQLKILKECETCILLDTGCGIIEIFRNGTEPLEKGNIQHFAFSVEHVQPVISILRKAGYEILVEPKTVHIGNDEHFSAEIAFCKGPLGEEIEFFHQMW